MASSIELANTVLDGRLEEFLRDWRERGDSLRSIARQLQRMNVNANYEQVRRWCLYYEIPAPRRAKESA